MHNKSKAAAVGGGIADLFAAMGTLFTLIVGVLFTMMLLFGQPVDGTK